MKKPYVLLAGVFIALMLSACGEENEPQRPECETVSVSAATSEERVNQALAAVKEGKYKNLVSRKPQINVPGAEKIDILSVNTSQAGFEEYCAYVKSFCTAFLGEEYSDERLYFIPAEDIGIQSECEIEGAYRLTDFKEELEAGRIDASQLMYFDSDKRQLILINRTHNGGWIIDIQDSSELKAVPEGVDYLSWLPGTDENVIKTEKISGSEEIKLRLSDKTADINEINNTAFANRLDSALDDHLTIRQADTFKCEEQDRDYLLTDYLYFYDGIEIESLSTRERYEFVTEDEEAYHKYSLFARPTGVNVSSAGVSYYYGDILWDIGVFERELKTICPPDYAIELASFELTEEVVYELEELSLCYMQTNGRLTPYWRLALKSTLDGSSLVYLTDCENGEGIAYVKS